MPAFKPISLKLFKTLLPLSLGVLSFYSWSTSPFLSMSCPPIPKNVKSIPGERPRNGPTTAWTDSSQNMETLPCWLQVQASTCHSPRTLPPPSHPMFYKLIFVKSKDGSRTNFGSLKSVWLWPLPFLKIGNYYHPSLTVVGIEPDTFYAYLLL